MQGRLELQSEKCLRRRGQSQGSLHIIIELHPVVHCVTVGYQSAVGIPAIPAYTALQPRNAHPFGIIQGKSEVIMFPLPTSGPLDIAKGQRATKGMRPNATMNLVGQPEPYSTDICVSHKTIRIGCSVTSDKSCVTRGSYEACQCRIGAD